MRKILTLLAFLCVSLSFGQIKVEGQLGGSNFIGATLNTVYEIPLGASREHRLIPKIGVGYLPPFWLESAFIFHAGLDYNYNNWGLGIETSSFQDLPFVANPRFELVNSVSVIFMPNFSYTFHYKNHTYLKLSTGILFAYGKYLNRAERKYEYQFEGDAIPSLSLSFGYRFPYPKVEKRFK